MKRYGHFPIGTAGWILVILSFCSAAQRVCGAERLAVDSVMHQDPAFSIPQSTPVFSAELKPLWIRALQRPDDELQRLAADAIANAKRLGMEGLENTADDLLKVIAAERESVTVRYAAARALVVLEARQAAGTLAQLAAKGNLQLAQLIEPALARWDYQPIRQEWLERVRDPAVSRIWLLLAIDGLRAVREMRASDPLLQLVTDTNQAPNVRLAAARAAAEISPSGLVETARQLVAKGGRHDLIHRLLAGTLLLQHDDEEAIALLREWVVDERPTVAALAFERLLELDPKLVFDTAEGAIKRPDARMRRLGAQALVAKGDVEAIRSLGPLLDDLNPANRRYVAASMAGFVEQDELKETVIEEGKKVLQGNHWCGLEQASLLLGHLEYKP
ncbi:MAG: HEAT repeat domain-containing protein, partial [Pirellulaceae bacterium]